LKYDAHYLASIFIYFKIILQVLETSKPLSFVLPKKNSLGGPIVAHCTTLISIRHILLSRLTIEEESTPDFTQNHHGCLMTSNALPVNDFLYLLSETVRNVIF